MMERTQELTQGMFSLECQIAQETRLLLEDPKTWKELQEARYQALMRAMELQRAEDVKKIMND